MARERYTIRLAGSEDVVAVDVVGFYADNATWSVIERGSGRVLGTGTHKWAAIDAAILTIKHDQAA